MAENARSLLKEILGRLEGVVKSLKAEERKLSDNEIDWSKIVEASDDLEDLAFDVDDVLEFQEEEDE